MATQQVTVDYLVDQMGGADTVTSRKMFGEYAIYCTGKVVALVCDDQLFVKPTAATRDFLQDPTEAPPYPGAKLYFLIPPDQWDDRQWLSQLIQMTADELPLPKPKKKKNKL